MTGTELRAWRLKWFGHDAGGNTLGRFKCSVCGDLRYAWGVQRASEWSGVPVERWKKWECPSSTVPKWVVDQMTDPFLNPGCDNRCRERVYRRARLAAAQAHGGE